MNSCIEVGKIQSNELIGPAIYRMAVFSPEIAKNSRVGQFVHVRVANSTAPLLRRPLSLAGADAKNGNIILIYRVVGIGTDLMAKMKTGDSIDCLGPLGTSFTPVKGKALLVGGGVGIAPLLYLAEVLGPERVTAVIGGRNEEELFWKDLFGTATVICTSDDGSIGQKGFVIDALPALLKKIQYDCIYTCGPNRMMEKVAALAEEYGVRCEVSLESYMACGTGGCLGCAVAGRGGKRYKVCHDGPVFPAEEVFFRA